MPINLFQQMETRMSQLTVGSQLERCLRTGRLPITALGCWVTVVAAGISALVAYSQTPGPAALPPLYMSMDGRLAAETKPWRLIVGIHPQCPCTLATISELQKIMSEESEVLSCSVLAFVPAGSSSAWTDTASIREARSTPGVEIVLDRDGETQRSLGIRTSGGTVLYDNRGVPRFHGGITQSRGHEGINLGSETIRALIQGRHVVVTETPVYGCRISE